MSLLSILGLGGSDPNKQAFNRNAAAITAGINAGTGALNAGFGRGQSLLGVDRGGNALDELQGGFNAARGSVGGGYGSAQNILQSLAPAGQRIISAGGAGARGDLLSGFGGARDALGSGYGDARDALSSGFGQAGLALQRGYGQQQGYLGRATSSYVPMVAGGQSAFNNYLDAVGANGADGQARARTSFENSLGYQSGLDTGLDSVMRNAAARGSLAGGNTDRDLYKFGSDYENQRSQDYIGNLQNAAGFYGQGLAGQAAGLGAQAEAARGFGTAKAGLSTDRGRALGDLSVGRGNALAALDQGRGGALANLDTTLSGQRLGTMMGLGSQRAGLATGQGTALGNLASTFGQGRAGIYGTGAAGQQNLGTGLANLQLQGMSANVENSNAMAQAQNQQDANAWGALLGLGKIAAAPVTGGLSSTFGGALFGGAKSLFG